MGLAGASLLIFPGYLSLTILWGLLRQQWLSCACHPLFDWHSDMFRLLHSWKVWFSPADHNDMVILMFSRIYNLYKMNFLINNIPVWSSGIIWKRFRTVDDLRGSMNLTSSQVLGWGSWASSSSVQEGWATELVKHQQTAQHIIVLGIW